MSNLTIFCALFNRAILIMVLVAITGDRPLSEGMMYAIGGALLLSVISFPCVKYNWVRA